VFYLRILTSHTDFHSRGEVRSVFTVEKTGFRRTNTPYYKNISLLKKSFGETAKFLGGGRLGEKVKPRENPFEEEVLERRGVHSLRKRRKKELFSVSGPRGRGEKAPCWGPRAKKKQKRSRGEKKGAPLFEKKGRRGCGGGAFETRAVASLGARHEKPVDARKIQGGLRV